MKRDTPSSRQQLAKLTRPRLPGAVPRDRLFALLDQARARSLIWVSSPPGAGKTTLVSSWLEARSLPVLWYQIDAGDTDLATFFHYLRLAAAPLLKTQNRRLPAFSADHHHNLAVFSTRFFRELFRRLPPGTVLVVEDFHEVELQSALNRVLSDAVEQIPDSFVLIIISRSPPLDWVARFIASERAATIDWHDLQLTLPDTTAIVNRRISLPSDALFRLHEQTGGWAAGLTLIMERPPSHCAADEPIRFIGLDRVFAYFADQIFNHLPVNTQSFLLKVAILPQMTDDLAARVSGEQRAGEILESLHHRQLFTERRLGQPPTYRFHALFRTFLLSKLRRSAHGRALKQITRRAADALADSEQVDEAINLYRGLDEWGAISKIVLTRAPRLISQGRFQTLHQWLQVLPAETLKAAPWLGYWLGLARLHVDVASARLALEEAHDRFVRLNDRHGMLLTAAAVIDTYFYDDSNFASLDRWIATLEAQLKAPIQFASHSAELHVYASALIAMLYAQPAHPLLESCVAHVSRLLNSKADQNQRMKAATILLAYCSLTCEFDRGRRLVAAMRLLVQSPDVADIIRYSWFEWLNYLHYLSGNYEEALAALDATDNLGTAFATPYLRASSMTCRAHIASACDNPELAAAIVHQLASLLDHTRPRDLQLYPAAKLWLAFYRRDFAGVLRLSSEVVTMTDAVGGHFFRAIHRLAIACAHLELDERHQAFKCIEEVRALVLHSCLRGLETMLSWVEAYAELKSGNTAAGRERLTTAFKRAKELEHGCLLNRLRPLAPQIAGAALALGVEANFVRDLVRRFNWFVNTELADNWWQPIQIVTLGSFRISIDGMPLKFFGKAQKRPLELLKYLVAVRAPVPFEAAADALWPDSDGDLAYGALEAALRRLRTLLHHPDAISRAGGKLALNPSLCWIDAWAFEDEAARIGMHASSETEHSIDQSTRFLWSAYRGHFLENESHQTWLLSARQRLRKMFTRITLIIGNEDERLGKWEAAAATYAQAMQIEDAKELSHALDRCTPGTVKAVPPEETAARPPSGHVTHVVASPRER